MLVRPCLVVFVLVVAGCENSGAPKGATPTSDGAVSSNASNSPQSFPVVDPNAPVATLLGKPVLLSDCVSPSAGIGAVEVGLHGLILGALAEDFREAHPLTLSQDEIDAFYKTLRETATHANADASQALPEPAFDEPKVQAQLKETQAKLASEPLPWLERLVLQGKERSFQFALEHKTVAATLAYENLLPLRYQAALYKKYGGKVVAMQISLEPVEAYSKLVQEAEATGKLVFHDESLKQVFWKRMNEGMQQPAIPPEQVDFSLPAWLKLPPLAPLPAAPSSAAKQIP